MQHAAGNVVDAGSPVADGLSDDVSQDIQQQESGHTDQAGVLQEQLTSALQRVAVAEKEAAAAKEAAGTELALMRRQLTSSQAGLAEAEQVGFLCCASSMRGRRKS